MTTLKTILLAPLCALLAIAGCAGGGGGGGSTGFSVEDVQVGDPAVSYANVEFTGDGRYMVWFEQLTDGSGLGTVWHCGVNPDTGELVPADGKGFAAFDSSALGRANPGMDSQGAYYVGLDRSGNLLMVRPTSATGGSVTTLATPADTRRRAVYPSHLPGTDQRLVLWILNSTVAGSGLDPRNSWFEIQYIDLDHPADIRVVTRQDKPVIGFAPLDIGFVRWFRDRPAMTYGAFDANYRVQVHGFDAGTPLVPPQAVTDDAYSRIDPYPLVDGARDILLAGIDGTATSHAYTRSGAGLFTLLETIAPPASRLVNPALAQSHEGIRFGGALYSAYQVNEQGSDFFDTTFNQTGEIWFTTVGQAPQRQWLISADNDSVKAEPEPYTGTRRVWVFYSTLPKGSNLATATWALRRASTPLQ